MADSISPSVIVAIHTYGKQQVKNPNGAGKIGAYKMGYSSSTTPALMEIYGDQAVNISSRRSSYDYIQILDPDVKIHSGYFLFRVDAEKVNQLEAITLQYSFGSVYRWHDNQWNKFPNRDNPDYSPTGVGPRFNPTGMLIVSSETGETVSAMDGITVEKTEREGKTPWHWLRGDTFPHRDLLKSNGCRWSRKRKAWYYVGSELPQAITDLIAGNQPAPDQALTVNPIAPATTSDTPPTADVKPIEPDPVAVDPEPPSIIITESHIGDDTDDVAAAVKALKQTNKDLRPIKDHMSQHPALNLPQAYIGEVSGDISGNVYCYGYATVAGECVFLNLGGPTMSVQAIRAKLLKGGTVQLHHKDGQCIDLQPDRNEMGMYTDYNVNLSESRFLSTLLVHKMVIEPTFNGKSKTAIIEVSQAFAKTRLFELVEELVDVPVFPEWSNYLWEAGKLSLLVRSAIYEGCCPVSSVELTIEKWTRLITGALEMRIITLPEASNG